MNLLKLCCLVLHPFILHYVNECRAIIHDLKQYDIDLMEEDTAGCKLLSHIIFSKLPTSVKRELVHKVDNNDPSPLRNFRELQGNHQNPGENFET